MAPALSPAERRLFFLPDDVLLARVRAANMNEYPLTPTNRLHYAKELARRERLLAAPPPQLPFDSDSELSEDDAPAINFQVHVCVCVGERGREGTCVCLCMCV